MLRSRWNWLGWPLANLLRSVKGLSKYLLLLSRPRSDSEILLLLILLHLAVGCLFFPWTRTLISLVRTLSGTMLLLWHIISIVIIVRLIVVVVGCLYVGGLPVVVVGT